MWRHVAFGLAAAWLLSLALPVSLMSGRDYGLRGYLVLLLGWVGLAAGQIGWFANIAFGLAIMLLAAREAPGVVRATIIAAILLVLTASSLTWDGAGWLETEIAGKEVSFGMGRYLWLATMLVAATAVITRAMLIPGKLRNG